MKRNSIKKKIVKRGLAGILFLSLSLSAVPVYAQEGVEEFDFKVEQISEEKNISDVTGEQVIKLSTEKINITNSKLGAYFYLTISSEEDLTTKLQMSIEDNSIISVHQILQEKVPETFMTEEIPDNAYWFHVKWISNGMTKIHIKWDEVVKEIQVIAANNEESDTEEILGAGEEEKIEVEDEEITDTPEIMKLPTIGWRTEGGVKYYYNVDGTKAKGFALIEDKLYYFDETTGALRQTAGWIYKDGKEYYCNSEGELFRNMFIKFNTTYYYMGDDGSVQKGIINVNGDLYYANPKSGIVQKNAGWIEYDGKSYYADIGGILFSNMFIKFDTTYYYMGIDGSVQKGFFYINNDLYYSDPSSGIAQVTEGWIDHDNKRYYSRPGGKLYVGQFVEIKGKYYCFSDDGSLYRETFDFRGNKYHANSKTGEIKFCEGWIEDDGEKYYSMSDGRIYYNQFIKFDTTYYYMGEDGSVQKGIINVGGDLYYANFETGIVQKNAGWIQYNGKRYYAQVGGILFLNQIITFGEVWYYMGSDGSVQTGIIDVNGNLYYADSKTGIIQKHAGWIKEAGKEYYAQTNGILFRNQMIKFDTTYYYMGIDGSVQKGIVQTAQGVYYSDPKTGIIQNMKEGWLENEGKKYYVGPNGKLYSNQIITFGDIWYYMGSDGSIQKGIVKAVNDILYYANPETGILSKKEGWIDFDGKKYYSSAEGKLYHNQIITFGDIWYYMGSDGSVQKGIIKTVNNVLYYANPETGVLSKKEGWIDYNGKKYYSSVEGKLYHNQIITFGNTWYYMGEDGSVQKGHITAVDGNLYYGNKKTGILQKSGWIESEGKRYYANERGILYRNQMIKFDTTYYYMGSDGSVQKGMINVNNDIYYSNLDTGIVKKNAGWIDYKGKRYYANENGKLYRNQFITFGPDAYYMDFDGSMVKGRKYINGIWYTFNEDTGVLERKAGWFTSGANKYYQKADGTLAKGYTDIEEVRYYFDSTGALASKMGIDVSQWQGNINWTEVKKAGVEFAMIRVGYRGSAAAGKLMADPYYKQNIEGALAAGIKVGVYFFSQAITVQEAKEEAQFTYNLIKNYNITYPVAFDSEYYNSDRDGRADYLLATQRTLMANTFCIEMQRLGYKPMVYASTSFFQTDLQLSMLTKWQLWVAQYNTVITHKGSYQCWQYTSTGKVNGINGNVDMNVWINCK